MNKEQDLYWLNKAIEHSIKAPSNLRRYRVGCVIVGLANAELSAGFTGEQAEDAHAEQVAISKALEQNFVLQGSSLYSSLEPCSTRLSGKKSCCERIIEQQIARVVFACSEPELFVGSNALAVLRNAGIEVVQLPELAHKVQEINKHLFDKH